MDFMEKFEFLYKLSKSIDKYQKNIDKCNKIKADTTNFLQKKLVSKIYQVYNNLLPYISALEYVHGFSPNYFQKQTDDDHVGFGGQFEYEIYDKNIVLGRIGFLSQVHIYFNKDKSIYIEHDSTKTNKQESICFKDCKHPFEDFSLKDLINMSTTLDYMLNNFSMFEADIQKKFLEQACSLEATSERQLSEMKYNANLIGVKNK